MKLFVVEAGRFSVLAVYNEDGVCQVMEKMRSVRVQHQDLVQQMAALLYEDVPANGPPEDPRRFGPLFDEIIYEFKAVEYVTQEERLGFRIACFFDGQATIVCTNAFYKRNKTPPDQVSLARSERERYFLDKDLHNITLVDWRPGGKEYD
jgi:hypothetical protein